MRLSRPPAGYFLLVQKVPKDTLRGANQAGKGHALMICPLRTPSSSQSPLHSISAWRQKFRSLPCSSSPHKTRFAGLLRGPQLRGRRIGECVTSHPVRKAGHTKRRFSLPLSWQWQDSGGPSVMRLVRRGSRLVRRTAPGGVVRDAQQIVCRHMIQSRHGRDGGGVGLPLAIFTPAICRHCDIEFFRG